jgi:hypothetical protein
MVLIRSLYFMLCLWYGPSINNNMMSLSVDENINLIN